MGLVCVYHVGHDKIWTGNVKVDLRTQSLKSSIEEGLFVLGKYLLIPGGAEFLGKSEDCKNWSSQMKLCHLSECLYAANIFHQVIQRDSAG